MTTQTVDHPKVLKKDTDGHWYAIPENMVASFVQAVEAIELAEWLSDEWYDATDYLNDTFGEYMKGDM